VDDVIVDWHRPSSIAVRIAARPADRRKTGRTRDAVRIGRAIVNIGNREVLRAGRRIPLTARQAQLPGYFLKSNGRVVSRMELVQNIWDNTIDPDGKNLNMYISKLRQLLEPDPKNPVHLLTVYGLGYRFVVDEPLQFAGLGAPSDSLSLRGDYRQ
jgi:DNA-binding response OmpR family regulator